MSAAVTTTTTATITATQMRATRFTRSIARTVRALRRERKLSQAQVSRRLVDRGIELHRSSISRIERGQADIPISVLEALCGIYRVNMGYVMLSAELGVLLREDAR